MSNPSHIKTVEKKFIHVFVYLKVNFDSFHWKRGKKCLKKFS